MQMIACKYTRNEGDSYSGVFPGHIFKERNPNHARLKRESERPRSPEACADPCSETARQSCVYVSPRNNTKTIPRTIQGSICMRGIRPFVAMCAVCAHACVAIFEGARAFVRGPVARSSFSHSRLLAREDKGISPIRPYASRAWLLVHLSRIKTVERKGSELCPLSTSASAPPSFFCPAGDAEMSPTGATPICSRGKHVL